MIGQTIQHAWARLPQRARAIAKIAGSTLAGLIGLVALTVGITESSCRGTPKASAPVYQAIVEAADRRDEVNSYLTYPEWSIVHAYEDLAGVMRRGSESDFGYLRSIRGFWSGLCGVKREASTRGPISFDYNSMLYTIGVSFTAEMGIKGLYETTIGRSTAWIRGATRTPEDEFALKVADDYAAFLRQVPWYEYPFGQKLWRFWADTPLFGVNVIRKLERRVALTLEYGSKGLYARVIKALAGLSPAPLRIRSVVTTKPDASAAADSRISVIKDLGRGRTLIETPRYRAFTEIIGSMAARGGDFVEIAGNSSILVTVIAPASAAAPPPHTRQLFSVPIQARPGFVRVGYDVTVDKLCDLIRGLAGASLELEHVYDY
jgi:hypothetical protein